MPKRGGKPGDIVAIPLSGGEIAYGQLLEDPYVAVYEANGRSLEDAADLAGRPIAFVVAVDHQPTRTGRWRVVGSLGSERTSIQIPDFFVQDWADFRDCQIVTPDGIARRAEIDECEGLERAAVWSAQDVEERIADVRAGKPNRALQEDALVRDIS